jgi:hypothetical protein
VALPIACKRCPSGGITVFAGGITVSAGGITETRIK